MVFGDLGCNIILSCRIFAKRCFKSHN